MEAEMRELVLQMGVSIDGGRAPDGRQTDEDMAAAVWPQSSSEYAAPRNEIPKVVFSKTLGVEV